MNIGLFGGTFNPIHRCHLLVAGEIQKRMDLDQILFIPSGSPPHKKGEEILQAQHRLEMVRLAIRSHKKFSVSDIEIDRLGKSYTVDTIDSLNATHSQKDQLYFIIGLDAFLEFSTWKDPSRLLSLCHFIVISRKGFFFREIQKISFFPLVEPKSLKSLDQGTVKRLEVPCATGKRLHLLSVPYCETCSTQIRRLLNHGLPIKNLLPHSVESYIIKNSLYQSLEERR